MNAVCPSLGRCVSTSAGLFALLFLHYTVPSLSLCADNKCLEGSFSFDVRKDLVEDHALVGHVIESVTVADPLCCFEKCQSDCRCISFNYLTNTSQENCQLNNENMNTNSSGLKLIEGSRYYDLVVNYNMEANVHPNYCANGCCASHIFLCLNGGTCHETCDVARERFNCSCHPCFQGKYCEIARCPTGWLCFNNSCFKEFMTAVTWNDAQQVCESLNSNLTSIHSAAESYFILGQVRSADTNEFWICFTDRANEGSFEWVDGCDVTYTNWIKGQPDDFQSNQDCGIFALSWNFGWDDGTCSSHTSRYICRKDIN